MPRLPDPTDLGQRPIPQSQRGGLASPNTAPYVGQMYGAVLREMGDELKRLQEQEDFNDVMSARNAFDRWDQDKIHDPEKGAVTKQRRDAFGLDKTLPAEFDTFSSGVLQSARSERAKKLVAEIAASRRDRVVGWASAHVLQQRKIDAAETSKANLIGLTQVPLVDANTADAQAQVIRETVAKSMPGAGSEAHSVAAQEYVATMYQGGIKRALIAGNTSLATTLLEKALAANAVSADAHATFNKEIRAKFVEQRTDTLAGTLDRAFITGKKLGTVDTEALDKAAISQAQGDHEVLKALRVELQYRLRQQEQTAKGEENKLLEQVMAERNRGTAVAKIKAMPAWKELSPVTQNEISEKWKNQQYAEEARADAREARIDAKRARQFAELVRDQQMLSMNGAAIVDKYYMNPELLDELTAQDIERMRFTNGLPDSKSGKIGVLSNEHVRTLATLWRSRQDLSKRAEGAIHQDEIANAYRLVFNQDIRDLDRNNPTLAAARRANIVMLAHSALAEAQAATSNQRKLTPEERAKTLLNTFSAKILEENSMMNLYGFGAGESPGLRVLLEGPADELATRLERFKIPERELTALRGKHPGKSNRELVQIYMTEGVKAPGVDRYLRTQGMR